MVSKFFNKAEDLSNKVTLNPVIKTADISRKLLKDLKKKFETGIILAKNEIKDIIKAI